MEINRISCLPLLTVPCRENDHCKVNNSLCFDGKCQCKPNYIYEESKCVPIYLNEHCQTNENCSKIEYAICSEKYKCACKDAYITIDRKTCAPSLGAACTDELHCVPANLLCINNKCQYDTKSYPFSNSKSAPGHLGHACLTNEDCVNIPNSKCSIDNICICNSNTIALNKFTCIPILHGLCTNDHQCYMDTFYCLNNRCQCKPNFTAVSANQCTKNHYKGWNHVNHGALFGFVARTSPACSSRIF
ncbi:prion-like-(Q/N-rich) domain-bearing protein 25 isoform X2 [Microplitis demolitor]|uniref:prion-like-(Q/N-rich) domain-bearing protein 25 isoform X2 n=1 Tax=Microplitis demolitor TaxID=69319 RepID=UPI00235B5B97|nr:prion-like-(Q/N-rich) domain-bearing protein 25 isoform X2 [Microplitis demolitor]